MATLIELSQANHPYYCSESNYYSNKPAQRYETMTDFLDEFESSDVDMNLCFRWDVRDITDDNDLSTGEYSAEVFLMLQRKGIFMPCSINKIEESEVDRFVAYLKKHHDTIKALWIPIA